jgi:hypothetical protein
LANSKDLKLQKLQALVSQQAKEFQEDLSVKTFTIEDVISKALLRTFQ